jgi:methenyltetrahydromethanopterin cyclohydrolase
MTMDNGALPLPSSFSLNGRALALADAMEAEAAPLRIAVSRGARGERLIDAGAKAQGGIAAGLAMARICLGGLGEVAVEAAGKRWQLNVRSSQPVLACLGSQYAGWSLKAGDFFALGSGPARALAAKEEIFGEIKFRDQAFWATIVLESATPPPPEIIDMLAKECGVPAKDVTVIHAPTQSLAGSVQVVARVLEVALHKAHQLKFPLARIVDGLGAAPLSPPHPDFVSAMGRTNDAIIFGGRTQLFVTGPANDARELARQLPSHTSRDYGKPFAEVFKAFKGDFYAIDPMLFSPAEAIVTALETGETFRAGAIDETLLDASFG